MTSSIDKKYHMVLDVYGLMLTLDDTAKQTCILWYPTAKVIDF